MNRGARSHRGIPAIVAVGALSVAACGSLPDDLTGPTATPPSAAVTSSRTSGRVDASPVTGPDEPRALAGHYTVEVVAAHPHDPDAYTQGLEFHDGLLLESTGRFGRSSRRWVVPETGEVVDIEPLDDALFGEGITMVDERIFQLTWTNGRVLVADGATLDARFEIGHEGQGWGICHDGTALVMSNGSAELTIRDPETFDVRSTVTVTYRGTSVLRLNELECRAGQVLANVYGSDEIVVIDTQTGDVVATIDAGDLRPSGLSIDDLDVALNGIAHDRETDTLYLTGKLWPVMYEVRLVAA